MGDEGELHTVALPRFTPCSLAWGCPFKEELIRANATSRNSHMGVFGSFHVENCFNNQFSRCFESWRR